jgi:hypothetical protein
MSPQIDRRIPAALLILRFFLGIFLLQWSIEKLILPDAAARIASSFYGVMLPASASYLLGVAELILSLALLFGFYRTVSYGLSLPGSHRDRGRELAPAVRPMGIGQGRQPFVALDVADLGRFCRAVSDAGMGQLDRRWLACAGKPGQVMRP